MQKIDYFLYENAKWVKQPLVYQAKVDDLLGYRYIGGSKDLFAVSIVEGRSVNQGKLALDPALNSSVMYINKHPSEYSILPGDFVETVNWETKQGLAKFLQSFFETLSPQVQVFFKNILTKDSLFIFEQNVQLAFNRSQKRAVYFSEEKDRLCVFFYPESYDSKPEDELYYIKIKRVAEVEEIGE